MECNYCANQFNHTTHVPRLLIFCGHSLCEACCRELHLNSRIQCPECMCNTFIEDINFLPKNLTLLKVNSGSVQNTCIKHQKKFQAFCEKEKMLLCVDCILQDGHRNHDMDSIKNSFGKQTSNLQKATERLENLLATTQEKYDTNQQNQLKTEQNYQVLYCTVKGYFDQLRAIIEAEEDGYLSKIKENFTNSETIFKEKNNGFFNKIRDIEQCIKNLKKSWSMSETEFLHNVGMRQALFASISFHIEEPGKTLTMVQSKNQIADSLTKSIEKNFKTQANTLPTNLAHRKQQSTGSNSIKAAKKVINQNQHSSQQNQNQKNFSKKNVKKQYSIPTNVHSSSSSNSVNNRSQNVSAKASQIIKEKNTNLIEPAPKKQLQYIGKGHAKYNMKSQCDLSMVEPKQSLFNSFMSNMTSFLSERKFLYVLGGFDEDSDSIIRMNLNSMLWETVTQMNCPRSKFGCIAIEKDIFIFGGKKGKERVSDAQIWSEKCWKNGSNLRKKRSGFGIVNIEHLIYIIGGNDGDSILNSVDCLDTQTGEWRKKEPMLEARDQLAVCLGKDNLIYAIGGFGGKNNEPLKSVECFDPISEKWKSMPPLQIERRALASAALADGIYAIGGFDGQNYLSSVEKYEEGSNCWIISAPLRKGRCTHSAISIFDSQEIIVLGGFDQVALDSVERYSLITNEWEELCQMPSARFMHSSVLVSE